MKPDIVEVADLNFKQMSHWAFTTEYINQEKDESTDIWKITTVRRTNNGNDVGSSKTVYHIGKDNKKYKSVEEVLSAYNQTKIS